MVDWSLARQVAAFASGEAPLRPLPGNLPEMASAAEPRLVDYTGLRPVAPIPPPETIDRRTWADVNLQTLRSLLEPVAERLDGRLGAAGPLAGPLRAVGGATLAAECGLVMGYISQRVLAQYELSLIQPEAPARLLFVGPNLERAIAEMEVEADSFLRWVMLHELTHVLQFSGVPWLRAHLGGLLREYLATVDVEFKGGAAGGLPRLPDPATLVERFKDGGLAALVQTREQTRLMKRIQAAMAVVEGYAEHAMDAVGAGVLPGYEGLRAAMERRRQSRSAPERILQQLLGLDLKLRQYELGKRFCDEVVALEGVETLNRVWSAPDALPSLGELSHPREWIARVAEASPAPA